MSVEETPQEYSEGQPDHGGTEHPSQEETPPTSRGAPGHYSAVRGGAGRGRVGGSRVMRLSLTKSRPVGGSKGVA